MDREELAVWNSNEAVWEHEQSLFHRENRIKHCTLSAIAIGTLVSAEGLHESIVNPCHQNYGIAIGAAAATLFGVRSLIRRVD